MAYKKTSEASLRKHDQNVKVKKPAPAATKASPAPSKSSPAPSATKESKPVSKPASTPSAKTKVVTKPDAPIPSNRKKAGGARPEGPAAGMPAKRRGSIKVGPARKAVVGSGRISNEVGDGPAGKRKKKKSDAKTRAGTSY